MGKLKSIALSSAAALLAVWVAGPSSALAAACVTASVSVYEAAGFSCSVGPITFSNITVLPTTSGSGAVTLGDFTPFSPAPGEYGLALSYTSDTGTTPDSTADVGWLYHVSGVPSLDDAFAEFAGTKTGTGTADLSETLSNGVTLSLTSPGATSATFAPIGFLSVIKDQQDFAGTAGSSDSSLLVNAFSTSLVPEPSTWAMMFLGFAGLGYVGFQRSRKASVSIV
jgi:hypothetical protein